MPMLLTKLMAAGLGSGLANAFCADTADNQTATGTNQATAFETSTAFVRFTTVASGTGCLLDNGARGDSQFIINAGANALSVYPHVGGSINQLATNAAFSIPAGSWSFFDRYTDTLWTAGNDAASSSFLQSGTGAVARTVQAKERERATPQDYNAAADGATNDTTALTNTAAAKKHIYLPAGTYLIDGLSLSGSGYVIEGDGAGVTILKGSASCTKILEFAGGSSASTDNVVRNLSFDMTNLTDDSSHIALAFAKSWNNVVEKITVTGQGSNKRSLRFGTGTAGQSCYTSRFTGCDFGSTNGLIQVSGNNVSTDATSTVTFSDCQFGQAIIDSVFGINFNAATVQGSLNKFVLSNALCMNIIGGDMEGTGTYLQIGGTVQALQSLNNNVASALTYSSGTPINSLLQDRDKGFFAKPRGKALLNIPTTGATTIYTPTDAQSSAYSGAIFLVFGDDGTRGWMDQIIYSMGLNPVTVSSNNTYGAGQPTRTYTYSGGNILITLSATAANNVRVLALEYMGQ